MMIINSFKNVNNVKSFSSTLILFITQFESIISLVLIVSGYLTNGKKNMETTSFMDSWIMDLISIVITFILAYWLISLLIRLIQKMEIMNIISKVRLFQNGKNSMVTFAKREAEMKSYLKTLEKEKEEVRTLLQERYPKWSFEKTINTLDEYYEELRKK